MIDVTGTIVELDGDYAIIRMDETGCGRCHEEGGCGGGLVAHRIERAKKIYAGVGAVDEILVVRKC